MAKISLLLAIFLASLKADGPDPRELVRRSVTAELENSKRAKDYTFLQRTEDRELDDRGHVKSSESKTYDVTMLHGSSYRRLIARDDRPLPAKEEKKEEEKLHRSIEDRRSESRTTHDKRVSEYDNRPGRNRRMLSEIPEAFDFRLRGEESIESRPAYIIEGTPHLGYQAKSTEARLILPKLKITVWIDKADLNWVRIHAEVIDFVSWALCLVRLAPGAHFDIEQTLVNNEVWLPHAAKITGSARIALIKKVNMEQEQTFKNFRKFQSDSQIVAESNKL
jgi:hypothetical protein